MNRNQIQITIRSLWPNFEKLMSVYLDDFRWQWPNFEKFGERTFIELPYATTMLKQTNLAAKFCKIRSKVKFLMCSQIIGN